MDKIVRYVALYLVVRLTQRPQRGWERKGFFYSPDAGV